MISRSRGRPRIPDEALLEELRRVAEEVDGVPTVSQMEKHGEYSVATYRNHFGRWNRALREAGFEPRERR